MRAAVTINESVAERKLFDLSGKTAIVTGGGTHIGKAISRALAAHGASVHIGGRRLEVCEATAAELRREGLKCTAHQCDAANEEDMQRLVETAVGGGTLDIAVANAGGAVMGPPAPNIAMDRWEATMRISATTALVTAQVAARRMVGQAHGRIVLLSSIYGFIGPDLRNYGANFSRVSCDYHAAKGAVVNMTRGLACELGRYGITVNCISPGQIPYPHSDPETVEKFRLANPLGRTGTPADIQGAALLLASDAGNFITGQNFIVDGGWSVW